MRSSRRYYRCRHRAGHGRSDLVERPVKTRITIRGQTYTVRADDSDIDIREVARYVDTRMAEVASSATSLDSYSIAMLAALNIASDYRRFQRDVEAELVELDRDAASVAIMLEAGLPARPDSEE